MAIPNEQLDDLINEPRETLDIEVKEWLNLSDNSHRAALAKEIIALANHGGGFLLIGFSEQSDGSFIPHSDRPKNLDSWSQDSIHGIIGKYIDPAIQCRVVHHSKPGSEAYPVIVVPGGHRVPVRAKAGSPDQRIIPHRIYIRRAGPSSEEPRTAEEWDRLLERCLQNRRSELLEAMRLIMSGVIPGSGNSKQSRIADLREFSNQASTRWNDLIAPLSSNAPPKFQNGYYDASFAIDGQFERPSLLELKNTILREVRNHSGWPPFLTISRAPYFPKPIDGVVECWMGPDDDGTYDRPAHHDFWRISPEGLFFTRRGYPEDGGFKDRPPGTTFDISTATWRLGEALLQASYIAHALGGADAKIIYHGRWTGLAGRRLVSNGNPNRSFWAKKTSAQDEFETTETVSLSAIPDALPEFVHGVLTPLYQIFDFYELPKRLVEEELSEMQKTNFAS